ncbi:MAG: DJ-1/PfpI family protein [Candidatus Micrarchaeaceae archaeon]
MKVAIVIPQNGFKDESLKAISEMLEKWNVEAVIASVSNEKAVGYHGAVAVPKIKIDSLRSNDFNAIVLIGGPGVERYSLYDFRPLLDILKHFSMNGKVVAGIDNAIKIIARANIIAGVKVAAPKDEDARRLAVLYKGILTNSYIELDKNVLTLNDPERSEELADRLLAKLGAK